MNTLLVVGGRPQTLRKAAELGLRVVFVQLRQLLTLEQARIAHATVVADYTDWDVLRPLVLALHEVYSFSHAISLAEQAMEPVGRINDLLGLGGTPHAVSALFRDKWAMRRHLQAGAAGPADYSVRAALVEGPTSVPDFAARHGYPVIVKPVDSTASRAVMRIDTVEQARAAWHRIEQARAEVVHLPVAALFPVDRFLVEQYIPGEEYSVEAFSFAGRHVVVAITEKLTRGFIELGHAQPARLEESVAEAVRDCVVEFLDRMGLGDGVSHTEVRIDAGQPRIVESHDRVGGDRIMDLVENAYGIDLELLSVGWPFRLVPQLPARPVPVRSAATRFLFADAGTVRAIEGVIEMRRQPDVVDVDVVVVDGQRLRAPVDNFDRAGQVIVVAGDTGAAIEAARRCAGRIRIVTEPENSGPSD